MIITKVQGGLGNQMFQWAFSKSISIKYNLEIILDKSFYSFNKNRTFELDNLNTVYYDLSEINLKKEDSFIHVNDTFNFKNLELNKHLNYYLDGYWQSEKYFIEYSEEIIKDFTIDSEICVKFKNQFKSHSTTSVHVRRGDYLTSNGYHPIQPMSYYKNAIDLIGEYDKLIIFSDDIEWCKNNFKFPKTIFFEYGTDLDQIMLMSICNNNIIANSTFSWWSAWLNKNLEKKIIAPNEWFGKNVNLDNSDLIPKSWIKI